MVDLGPLRDRQHLVHHRVEQADDLAVDIEAPRHPDVFAVAGRDPLGDRGLPVPRRAEQEHRLGCADGLPDLLHHLLGQRQIGERGIEVVRGRHLRLQRLPLDAVDVGLQRDRGGSEVGRDLRLPPGPLEPLDGHLPDVVVGPG